MNLFGLLIGLLTLVLIGLGFVWVIFGERYFSYQWWPVVIGAGIFIVGVSLFIKSDLYSALVGVLGASFIWGATELKSQAVRSELGWFKYRGGKIPAPFEKFLPKGNKSELQSYEMSEENKLRNQAIKAVGMFSGPSDLSENHDEYFADAIKE